MLMNSPQAALWLPFDLEREEAPPDDLPEGDEVLFEPDDFV